MCVSLNFLIRRLVYWYIQIFWWKVFSWLCAFAQLVWSRAHAPLILSCTRTVYCSFFTCTPLVWSWAALVWFPSPLVQSVVSSSFCPHWRFMSIHATAALSSKYFCMRQLPGLWWKWTVWGGEEEGQRSPLCGACSPEQFPILINQQFTRWWSVSNWNWVMQSCNRTKI